MKMVKVRRLRQLWREGRCERRHQARLSQPLTRLAPSSPLQAKAVANLAPSASLRPKPCSHNQIQPLAQQNLRAATAPARPRIESHPSNLAGPSKPKESTKVPVKSTANTEATSCPSSTEVCSHQINSARPMTAWFSARDSFFPKNAHDLKTEGCCQC